MNAQEAIESMEKFLNEYVGLDEEALVIVLESAKLFHEYSVPENFSFLQKNLGNKEVKSVETLYGVPLYKLGISPEDFIEEENV